MKNIFPFVSLLVLVAACSQPASEKTVDEKQTSPTTNTLTDHGDSLTTPQSLSGCYTMIIGKDTAFMQLKQTGDEVTGPLVYKRFEKDSNTGTVSLNVKTYTARGWYSFSSEGKTSVRQIVFKIDGSNLTEGYGDIEMKGDSAMFKYPHALKFEAEHPFILTACK